MENTGQSDYFWPKRLGSRFWVNETSQISERYSDQMQAVMKLKSYPMSVQMCLSIVECQEYGRHAAFDHERLACYGRNFNLESTLFGQLKEKCEKGRKFLLDFSIVKNDAVCVKNEQFSNKNHFDETLWKLV